MFPVLINDLSEVLESEKPLYADGLESYCRRLRTCLIHRPESAQANVDSKGLEFLREIVII